MTCPARILVVGTELLGGKADANGPLIARELEVRGFDVRGIAVVPDDRGELAGRFRDAIAAGGLVVAAGGLGPTEDDVTREALSDAAGVAIVEDAGARARIEERLARRGVRPNALTLRQALVPAGSEALVNVTGAAAGAVLVRGRSVIVLLPGPPGELGPMLGDACDRAVAALASIGVAPGARRAAQEVVLAGIGESDAALAVAGRAELAAVSVAWLARPGEVRLRLSGDAAAVDAAFAAARETLRDHVVSTDGRTLAEVLVATLVAREETIAAAESCTGGLVSAALTDVPGSSAVVRAGIVSYSNDAKIALLDVDPKVLEEHGAVSEPVAVAMAQGVRRAAQADWGIGVTGIAGPGGGSEDKPVGLVWIALVTPDGRRVAKRRIWSGSRDDVRRYSVGAALDMVRREL